MYQPGMDQGLARIRCQEQLGAVCGQRTERPSPTPVRSPAMAWRLLALVVLVPTAVWVVWTVATH